MKAFYWLRTFLRFAAFLAGALISLPFFILFRFAPDPRALEDFFCREIDYLYSKGCLTKAEADELKKFK
ncbi:hypothetical protein pVco7_gp109 [Vibrio phage pVco-7]|uniref:Uncharacterized protein n=1 Tax=Vibrio phage pVco-5 TaxID=1965485 RepID=A0A1W6JUZ8_9CAUD|nr:hypothetical protein KNT61_gp110 [Vibrio phage pVco-5]ARM71098.1 hypothetical protein pVco5_109 [Vibrio phage pVco-5]